MFSAAMLGIGTITHRPLRILGFLAALLAAVAITVGSGAVFTAESANPSNAFSSGTLSMSNSKDNQAILTASGMKPADSTTGTVDIENTGSLSGTFTLSRTDLSDSDGANPMSERIDLVVKDCGDFSSGTPTCEGNDPTRYSGTLAAMSSAAALGAYAAGEKHRYEFTATFSGSAGNAYQGESTSATFQWDATQ